MSQFQTGHEPWLFRNGRKAVLFARTCWTCAALLWHGTMDGWGQRSPAPRKNTQQLWHMLLTSLHQPGQPARPAPPMLPVLQMNLHPKSSMFAVHPQPSSVQPAPRSPMQLWVAPNSLLVRNSRADPRETMPRNHSSCYWRSQGRRTPPRKKGSWNVGSDQNEDKGLHLQGTGIHQAPSLSLFHQTLFF